MLLVLPDGSKSLVPAAWTGLGEGQATAAGDVPAATATLGRLGDLLAACVLVSALSARCRDGDQGGLPCSLCSSVCCRTWFRRHQ